MSQTSTKRVALVTLGCARNEVDSEELAARLTLGGWSIVEDAEDADAVLVNTCGFVDVAKKDSIDTVLQAADLRAEGAGPQAVVAVGCLAERYGRELAESLPEADAVLGFDQYADISDRLDAIMSGERVESHTPRDRRQLLPLAPVERRANPDALPGHGSIHSHSTASVEEGVTSGWTPPVLRRRLDGSPVAPVKLASGCDRRCTFCAIPSFRGSFVSRVPDDVLAETSWLVESGVREVVLVSENSTSYGKDLGDLRLLEALLPRFQDTGVERVRVAYLQPAEVRPGLLEAIARTPKVATYFDLSFQHASPAVLRRMRRFGGRAEFIDLVTRIRQLDPEAGIRSNVIVGFPGETDEEFEDLLGFLAEAQLDAVGVFGYSDEDGTEAADLPGKVDPDIVAERVEIARQLVDELMSQRAEERVGTSVRLVVESVEEDDSGRPVAVGRADHQGPDDAATIVLLTGTGVVSVGDVLMARVVDTDGVDLVAESIDTA